MCSKSVQEGPRQWYEPQNHRANKWQGEITSPSSYNEYPWESQSLTFPLESNAHVIVGSECFVAVRALAHSRLQPLLDTISAKDVTTCLHYSVLEIFSTDGANG